MKTLLILLMLMAIQVCCSQQAVSNQLQTQLRQLFDQRQITYQQHSLTWDVHITRNGAAYQDGSLPRTTTARIVVSRDNEITHVKVLLGDKVNLMPLHKPSENKDFSSLPSAHLPGWELYFGDGWGLFQGGTLSVGEQVRVRESAAVYPCPGNCLHYPGAHPPTEFYLSPVEFIFLTGANPFELFGADWVISGSSQDTIQLRASYQDHPFEQFVSVNLSLKPTGALTKAVIKEPHRKRDSVISVLENQKWNGIWMPKKFQLARNSQESASTFTFTLKSIRPNSKVKLEVPLRTQVSDTRLIAYYDQVNQVFQATREGANVLYAWNGSLPSESELRKMALEQGKLPKESGGIRYSWLLLLPGVLLIGGGAAFYFRSKNHGSNDQDLA